MLIPWQIREGYPGGFAAANNAAAATIAILIPPSIPMILYALVSNVSVGALFLAGVLPGLMLASGFILVCYLSARFRGFPVTQDLLGRLALARLAFSALPALLMPVLILASLRFGIATPTEVSVMAVLYALVVATVVYRDMTLARFLTAVVSAGRATGVVMLVIMASAAVGWIMTFVQAPQAFAAWATGTLREPWLILLAMNGIMLLAGETEVALVDTLAPGLDLAPLGALLANPAVLKVLHACRQDVEIFVLRFGAAPAPLFDTQIAAMVAGFGDQASYDGLVRALAGAHIDKAHRFSDWAARPLSEAQMAYAAADVTHLRTVYRALAARLEAEGRTAWVAEEMAALADADAYRPDPEAAWEKLHPRTGSRRFLAVLRAMAAWREREAQRVNIPRQRLLRDETLLEVAATMPATPTDLARARRE